jgi:uncharacterized protein (DUF4415 family)
MKRDGNIATYTKAEIEEMLRRGEDETNWERLRNMTDEELEASIDYEDEGHFDSDIVYLNNPPSVRKKTHVWVDCDVLEWFESSGDGYQSRMNEALRAYMDAHQGKDQSS